MHCREEEGREGERSGQIRKRRKRHTAPASKALAVGLSRSFCLEHLRSNTAHFSYPVFKNVTAFAALPCPSQAENPIDLSPFLLNVWS